MKASPSLSSEGFDDFVDPSCSRSGIILSELQRTLPIATSWAIFSFGLSYYNSWLLKASNNHFPFPLFYTSWHMITQFVGTSLLFSAMPNLERPSWQQFKAKWQLIVAMGVLSLVTIGCENSALSTVSLTVHESVKSAVPVLTLIWAYLIERRLFTWLLVVAVVGNAACTGLVTADVVSDDADVNSTIGVVLTVIGSIAASLRPVFTAMLMIRQGYSPCDAAAEDTGNKEGTVTATGTSAAAKPVTISPMVVVWYEAAFCCPAYICLWAMVPERDASLAFISQRPMDTIAYVGTGAAMAFCYANVLNMLIQITSSLTSTVIGSIKHVIMTITAAVIVDNFFREKVNAQAGYQADNDHALVVLSALFAYVPFTSLYAYLMLSKQAELPSNPNAPTEASSLLNKDGSGGSV